MLTEHLLFANTRNASVDFSHHHCWTRLHNCCCRSPRFHRHHWSVSLSLKCDAARTDIHNVGMAPHRLCYTSPVVHRLPGSVGSDSHTSASFSSFVSSRSSAAFTRFLLPSTSVLNPSVLACAAKRCCTSAHTTSQSVTMDGSAIE